MNRIYEAALLACAIFAVALLAAFGIVPEAVVQYAPLAAVPFIVSRQRSCGIFGKSEAL